MYTQSILGEVVQDDGMSVQGALEENNSLMGEVIQNQPCVY